MGIQNSLSDFYVGLYHTLYSDVASAANVPRIERDRDLTCVASRTRSEGLSFLTKTLPRLGKAIDTALSTGGQLQCPYLSKRKDTQIPKLFGELISRVFDSDGRERSDACPAVLGHLRQLLFIFYKLELPYQDEMVAKAISTFVEVDAGCSLEIEALAPDSLRILQTSRKLIRLITHDLDLVNIKPKHGPGVVSTGQVGKEKTFFNRVIDKLEAKYSFIDYFHFNLTHVCDRLHTIHETPSVSSGTAKLIPVPKDSRGPRLISAEPVENQWIQQGQMANIVDHLEAHRLTQGRINFRDQEINGALALEGSRTQEWCTLDMKEASDRVSVDLVEHQFHPHIYAFLDASRSTHTTLPDGTLHLLKKFAPMGSALCFPVEALIFWSLAVSSIICKHSVPLSRAVRLVYVYGDDIICRSEHHATIRQYLPKFGLLLNEEKCCTAGFFRESCGVDAYKGFNVTPAKISSVWSHTLTPATITSYVEYSNSLYYRGYWNAAKFIEDKVQSLVLDEYHQFQHNRELPAAKRVKLRRVGPAIPYTQTSEFGGICFVRPGLHTGSMNTSMRVKKRFNHRLQRAEVYCPRVIGPIIRSEENDWEELLARVGGTVHHFDEWDSLRNAGFSTLEQQLWGQVSHRYDASVRKGTLRCQLHPAPENRAGVYAVPHRNRIQWGWSGSKN